jgi:membrane dipeptidase
MARLIRRLARVAPMREYPIVDGHLDLAELTTLFGRDLTISAAATRAGGLYPQATVSLPDMKAGGVAVALATVTPGFRAADVGENFQPQAALYRTPAEAERQALCQVAFYEAWERDGIVRIVRSVADLDDHMKMWRDDRKPGLVLLMEGADPIVDIDDLPLWWGRGLRGIGLTYGDTRYGTGVAGGSETFKRGGLTPVGVSLLELMAETGFFWDVSHLTEEGVWEGLDLFPTRVCASHANARALVKTDRHLSDGVIRELAAHGGTIGIVLYNGFLESRWQRDPSIAVTIEEHVRRHAEHIARVAGWECVGVGSDLDGGFGAGAIPVEMDTIADLARISAAAPVSEREGMLGGNWLKFLRSSLPAVAQPHGL